jgi:drug/metabolite transporter (DMT)-like permease
MDNRKAIDHQAISLMLLLSVIWAMQQVALKAAAPDMAPLLQIVFRSAIATVLVGAIILMRKEKFQFSGVWYFGVLAGLSFSLEYYFIGESLKYTSASHVTVLLYSAPIFVALVLHFVQASERLNLIQWLGISLAFCGIAFTFLLRDLSSTGSSAQTIGSSTALWGDFLALLSGIFWAGATVVVRCSKLSTIPAAQTLFYQIITATFVLGIAAITLQETHFKMTALVWSSVLYQGVVVCCASFLTWFWLLKRYPASQLGVFSFITPLFGIIFSMWLLNETLEMSFIIGACLVLLGITLVTVRKTMFKQLFSKTRGN